MTKPASFGTVALFSFTTLVAVFLVLPLLVIIPISFTDANLLVFPPEKFSWRWYHEFFSDPVWLNALKNSLIVGIASTILATTFGTLAAFGLVRDDLKGKAFWMALFISPMVVPTVVLAVALYLAFARFGLIGTYLGLILGHTLLSLPFVIITVGARLQSFSRTQVRAGLSLGGTPFYVFRRVTLPQIAPGVAAGGVFAFATSFDEVVLALFLSAPEQRTLPRQIFAGIKETISPTVAVAAALLIGLSVAVVIAMELFRWIARRRKAAATTKSTATTEFSKLQPKEAL